MDGYVTTRAAWASGPSALASRGPWGRRRRGTSGPARSRVQLWERRSVHRLAKTASPRRIGAYVYTVALWAWVVGGLGIAIVYTNGRIGPLRAGLGHLCTLLGCGAVADRRGEVRSVHRLTKMASRCYFGAFVYTVATRVAIRIATRAASGGASASTTMACRWRPLAGLSRLVGKTDSERVAPLLGWHLHRGVNPHEPLKNPFCSMPQTRGWRYRCPFDHGEGAKTRGPKPSEALPRTG